MPTKIALPAMVARAPTGPSSVSSSAIVGNTARLGGSAVSSQAGRMSFIEATRPGRVATRAIVMPAPIGTPRFGGLARAKRVDKLLEFGCGAEVLKRPRGLLSVKPVEHLDVGASVPSGRRCELMPRGQPGANVDGVLIENENRSGFVVLTCCFRWSCRESNPGPTAFPQGFSVRSPLCLYSDLLFTRTSQDDDPSRCLVSRQVPRPNLTVYPSS